MAGFYLGLGISCILLAQPWLYMALGFSWLFTAFGRMVSMLSDRGEHASTTGFRWSSNWFSRPCRWRSGSASCHDAARRLRGCDKTVRNHAGQRVAVDKSLC